MVISSAEEKKLVDEGKLSKNRAKKHRVREDRQSRAIGKIVFTFEKDAETGADVLAEAKWVEDEHSQSIAEWIRRGTCRRDPSTCPELTPWELGPKVMPFLPFKPGERIISQSGECDREGNQWAT